MKILAALLLSLSLAGFAHSDQIAKDLKLEVLDNFDLGLVSNLSSNKQSKTSATKVRNFYGDKKIGCLVKGGGTEVAGSTPTLMDIRAGITFYHNDGSKEYLVADSSQVFATTDFRLYRSVVTGLNTNYSVRFKQIEGDIWVTNGFNTVTIYTSTAGILRHTHIPKGRDIEYNPDGRVWMYGTPEDASELRFSAIRSTDGLVIQPTDRRAWPASHSIYVNRGDGEQGTFVKNLAGTLICGKESSIHRIEGKTPTSYKPVLVSKNGGVISAESVTEDGAYLYGQGRDGFYEINATTVRRITDHISPDVELIRTDSLRTGEFSWDTYSDFARGSVSEATVTVGGILSTIQTPSIPNFTNLNSQPGGASILHLLNGGVGNYAVLTPTNTLKGGGRVTDLKFWVNAFEESGNWPSVVVRVKNTRTNEVESFFATMPPNPDSVYKLSTMTTSGSSGAAYFLASDLNAGNMQIQLELTAGVADIYVPTTTGNAFISMTPLTTGQFISEISTASPILAWDSFDAVTNSNGGSISFFYKTATSAVNIATYPWISVTPGNVIGSSISNNYIQWAATIAAISSVTPSNVDSVSINYLQGIAANTRSFGTKWDGRWWIGVSTEGTGNFPLIYKKYKNTNSFKDAFTQFDGIQIRCFWKDGDSVLYGGGSTWAAVMRLDYGTSYNGSPISAYWETPDLPTGKNFFEKEWNRWLIDVDEEPSRNIRLGVGVDGGAYTYTSYSIDGDDRLLYPIYANTNNVTRKFGKALKFRIENNEDTQFTFNALGILYRDTERDQAAP